MKNTKQKKPTKKKEMTLDGLARILRGEFGVVHAEIREVKTDVSVLKKDVNELKEDVKSLDSRLEKLETEFHNLLEKIDELITLFRDTREEVAVMAKQMERLEARVTALEASKK